MKPSTRVKWIKEKITERTIRDQRAREELDILLKHVELMEGFILKTCGESEDPEYIDSPDHWHDIGWEGELERLKKEISF